MYLLFSLSRVIFVCVDSVGTTENTSTVNIVLRIAMKMIIDERSVSVMTKIFIRFIKEELVPLCFASAKSSEQSLSYTCSFLQREIISKEREREKKACPELRRAPSERQLTGLRTNCLPSIPPFYVNLELFFTYRRACLGRKETRKLFIKLPLLNLKMNDVECSSV